MPVPGLTTCANYWLPAQLHHNFMKGRRLLLLFTVFTFSYFFSFKGQAQEMLPFKPVDREVKAFMARWQIAGGTVALVRNGRLVYNQAYGQADTNMPAQPHHLFRIASLSKPITALAIMTLKAQGLLKLQDEVFGPQGLLPDAAYPCFDRRMLNITVRHLLQHTAGWDRDSNSGGDPMFNPVYIARQMGVGAPADTETIIRYVLQKPLDFTPGTQYAYSNFGYAVLGRVVEVLSGMSYESYVQTNILHPLGILDMRLAQNTYAGKELQEVRYFEDLPATSGAIAAQSQQAVPWPYSGFNIEAMDAHGGWIASAADLAKILAAADGLTNRPDILSPEDLQQLWLGSAPNPGYALGWMVNSQGAAWHTGSLPGSSTLMALLPDGTAWVLLFNGRHDSAAYFQDLDQLMWQARKHIWHWPDQDLFLDPVLAEGAVTDTEVIDPDPDQEPEQVQATTHMSN
jgi:CubicO group peptidase (beta-lactamase class C family)